VIAQFQALAHAANDRGFRFLLIGGHAVNAYGYSRKTFDLDLAINRDDSEAWRELMLGLGYQCIHEQAAFIQFAATDIPQVDLMKVSKDTFEKLMETSEPRTALGIETRVPSLESLIAMKLHAARHSLPHRRHKDLMDIFALVEANNVDVTSDGFRQLCEKYGTAELYAEIVKSKRST
jgi:predicted nucleotidyltransferase